MTVLALGTKAAGTIRLALYRVGYRTLAGGSRQTLLSILGVALAVALVLSVTSVSLGLASQGSVRTESADYWIVPEESQGSAVTGVEGTRFGQVHPVAERLTARSDVAHATPVLFDIIQAQPDSETDDPSRIFVIGIVPRTEGGTVVGLPTESLTAGDPYYANGSYDGRWTGEAVLSRSAATVLNASAGDGLAVSGRGDDHALRVVDTSPAQAPGIAQFPVAVVHLSEAQRLTGSAAGDEADQFLVDTTAPSGREALTGVYPHSEVVSQQGLLAHNLRSSDLPLAMSIAAALIAVVAGVLIIVTTMGFEVTDDAEARAVLAALGIGRATRLGLVAAETVVTAAVGGLLGIVGWLGAVAIINVVASRTVSVPVAVLRPELAAYGFATAMAVGLLSVPFLLLFTRRSTLLEALPQ